jgi:hypothetical protein
MAFKAAGIIRGCLGFAVSINPVRHLSDICKDGKQSSNLADLLG